MPVDAFVDAEALLQEWINSQADVVGSGNPITLGAHITRGALRSPAKGSYVLLERIGGFDTWLNEAPSDTARVSGSVFGPSKAAAARAAYAYANRLRRIPYLRPAVGGSQLVAIDALTGPLYVPSKDGDAQYLVDVSIAFVPLP